MGNFTAGGCPPRRLTQGRWKLADNHLRPADRVFRMEIMSIKFGTLLGTKKMLVFLIVIASIIATIIALNFIPGEKKVQTRISEIYAVHDPQFLRSMSHLLGHPWCPATRSRN